MVDSEDFAPRTVVGISGSPSLESRSRTLLTVALRALEQDGARTVLVDVAAFPADAVLGRARSEALAESIATVTGSVLVIASTPVYRATYTGLLKCFFDLLPLRALKGKVALGVATGASPAHAAVIEHGLRPLFASLDAVVAPGGVYATDAAFTSGAPNHELSERVAAAARESFRLAQALHHSYSPRLTPEP